MALRYIGTDNPCPNTNCPTVWVDDADDSIVIQGFKLDAETMAEVNASSGERDGSADPRSNGVSTERSDR